MSVTRPTRRIAVSLAALVSLGVIAVSATALTGGDSTTVEADVELVSTSTCYDMVSIGIGGRRGSPDAGVKMLTTPDGTRLPAALSDDFASDWVDEVVDPANGAVQPESYAAIYLQYPADMASYDNAVNTGVDNAKTVMSAISASCPDTRFAIVGYSEGADVARRTALEIGNQTAIDGKYGIVNPANVVGVVILADAGRATGEGPFPGAADPFGNPDNYDVNYQGGNNAASGAGALPGTSGGFGALDGKVASFCSNGDLTCSLPESTSLIHLAANVGRQLNVDALERDGLTPATAADVATVIGRVAFFALNDIVSQDNWMASDETFLDVLIKVSEPGYDPTKAATPTAKSETTEPIDSDKAANLAYLPSKLFKEVVGLITDNQNTIPVLMNDPYGLTLGPGVGHHFDYWRDADPVNGKPLTSAQYAAAWLTQLAKDAESGKPVTTPEAKESARLAVQADPVAAIAAVEAATVTESTTTESTTTESTTTESTTATESTTTTAATTSVAPTTTAAPSFTAPAPASVEQVPAATCVVPVEGAQLPEGSVVCETTEPSAFTAPETSTTTTSVTSATLVPVP